MKIEKDGLSHPSIVEVLVGGQVHCPACLEFLSSKSEECPSCGILVSQFKRVSLEKRIKISAPALTHLSSYQCEQLEAQWAQVLASYQQTSTHDQFLKVAYGLRALPYVVFKYSELLLKDPADDVADLMTKRAKVLAEQTFSPQIEDAVRGHDWNPMVMRFFTYLLYFSIFTGVFLNACVIAGAVSWAMAIFGTLLIIVSYSIKSWMDQTYSYS